MAGTKAGGQAAAATNKSKYGADFYAKIGAKGGKLGTTGGFFADRELASRAGAIGGANSRRGPAKTYKVYTLDDELELTAPSFLSRFRRKK